MARPHTRPVLEVAVAASGARRREDGFEEVLDLVVATIAAGMPTHPPMMESKARIASGMVMIAGDSWTPWEWTA